MSTARFRSTATTAADRFLENTPMRAILGIPPEVLDQAMAKAYCLYQAGRLADAEILCKGLLAADHRYWWAYSLYAAVLQKLGRSNEALVQVECGLRFEPGQAKLVAMRAQILGAAASTKPRAPARPRMMAIVAEAR